MAETLGQAYIEIIPTTEGISDGITKAMGGAGDSAGKSFGSMFKTAAGTAMGNLAAGAIQATANAAANFAKEAVNTGKEFDAAMAQVAATSGKTMEELESEVGKVSTAYGDFEGNLRDFAQFMGGNTAFSTKEAADALNYMALAGYDAQTSMNMLPNVLNLAAAGAMDLADASDMVTDVSSALNLDLDETATMVDQMAKAAASSNTSVAQLGAAMLKIGGTAANMKGGTQELSTALGILANNGIKSAEGGTHLRNMILSLQTPGDKATNTLERMGLNAKFIYDEFGNMRGMDEIFRDLSDAMGDMTNAQKDAALSAVFNKTDLSAVRAMLAGVGTSFNDLGGALAESGVDWDKYADKVWAAEGAIEGISGDIAYDIAQGFSDAEIQDYLVNEYEIDATDAIAAINAAKNAVVDSESAWDDLNAKIGDAEGSAQKMADTQLNNLAGDITKFDSALSLAYQAVSDKLSPSLRELVQFGTEAVSELTSAFNEGGLEGLMSTFGDLISQAGTKLIDALPTIAGAGMELVGALGQGIMDNLPMLFNTAIQIVVDLANRIAEGAPQMIPAAVSMILELVEGLLDNIDIIIDAAIALQNGLAEGLIQAMPVLLEKAPEIIEKLVTALIENLPKMIEASLQLMLALQQGLIDNLPLIIEAAFQIIGALVAGCIEEIPAIIDMCNELFGQMAEFFFNADSESWGTDLIQGLVNGIKGMIGKVAEAAAEVAAKIASYIHFSEPDVGPLSNFHTFAPDMMELFAKGIRDNEDLVTSQMAKSFDFKDAVSNNIYTDVMASPRLGDVAPTGNMDTAGLYDIMSKYLPMIAENGGTNVSLEGDAAGIFNLVRKQNSVFTRANGRSAFA